jgi:hypothetical protein
MDRNARILTAAVEEYQLQIGGVTFWAPYWINAPESPYFVGAPYTGKATPRQLKRAVMALKAQDQPKTGEGYRKLMVEHGLGVDCSALAYHALDRLLRRRGSRLSEHVFAAKAEVVQASQRPRWRQAGVTQETIQGLPPFVSIDRLHQLFGVNPRWSVNAARLTSDATTIKINHLGEARPGDMIKLSGFHHAHLGVVVAVDARILIYADSSREWGNYGGVRFVTIKLNGHDELANQTWVDRRFFFPEKGDSLRRLKVWV